MKYEWLHSMFDNIFILPELREQIFGLFSQMQKTYFAFCRLNKINKHRKYPLYNTTDIVMNPIAQYTDNVIEIIQNKKLYLFTRQDIINIMNAALSNSPYFFSNPLPIKNPYNNMFFKKSDLYNFYFFIKNSLYIMPELIHLFFLSHFVLAHFRDNNEPAIQDYYIRNYIETSPPAILVLPISYMFNSHNIRRIKIHAEFPQAKLIEIMKPYLLLFYQSNYSVDLHKRKIVFRILHNKLIKFSRFNRNFGRKYIHYEHNLYSNSRIPCITFNENHILFNAKTNNNIDEFMNSHIGDIVENDDNSVILSESDSEIDLMENYVPIRPIVRPITEPSNDIILVDTFLFTLLNQ